MSFQYPKKPTPCCGYLCDRASPTEAMIQDDETIDYYPMPGDLSICINCGRILAFDNELELRIASIKDIAQAEREDLKMMRKTQLYIQKRGPLKK